MYPNFFLKNLNLLKMNYGPVLPRFRAIRGLSTGVRAILLIKLRNPWKWGFLKRILRRNEAENGHAYEAKYRSREVKEFIGAFNSHRKMYPYFYLILGISPHSAAPRRALIRRWLSSYCILKVSNFSIPAKAYYHAQHTIQFTIAGLLYIQQARGNFSI